MEIIDTQIIRESPEGKPIGYCDGDICADMICTLIDLAAAGRRSPDDLYRGVERALQGYTNFMIMLNASDPTAAFNEFNGADEDE